MNKLDLPEAKDMRDLVKKIEEERINKIKVPEEVYDIVDGEIRKNADLGKSICRICFIPNHDSNDLIFYKNNKPPEVLYPPTDNIWLPVLAKDLCKKGYQVRIGPGCTLSIEW